MTDKTKTDIEIDRFFTHQLLPLKAASPPNGETPLAVGQDKNAETYFVQRAHKQMSRSDFESGGIASVETAQADLIRACERTDAAYMVALAPGIAALASALREGRQESSDVSEFVYAMY